MIGTTHVDPVLITSCAVGVGGRFISSTKEQENTAAQYLVFAACGDKGMLITRSEATACSLKMS